MDPIVNQTTGSKGAFPVLFITRCFRWFAFAIFAYGLLFVLGPSIAFTLRKPPTDGTFGKVLLEQLGFLSAWLTLLFTLHRFTSLKPRPEPPAGPVITFNMMGPLSRFFGVVFTGIPALIGWVFFVQPLATGQLWFHWQDLLLGLI